MGLRVAGLVAAIVAVGAALAIVVGGSGGGRGRRSDPAPLIHEAYVWQRAWTGAVAASVAGAPAELTGLRVLTVEIDPRGASVWPTIDVAALVAAGRPVTAVVRLDGSRPIAGLPLAPLLEQVAAWRAAGVEVAGVEIDHDCATAALASYAAWLAAARPSAQLRWSITALPTWAADAAALRQVAAAVDELVVQVHAVRAPRIFDAGQARRWLDRFAAIVDDRPLRVALPTYRVKLGGADPVEVAGLVGDLERAPVPGVRGVVWFRLPVDGNDQAWSAPTLRAVIAGAPLAPAVTVRLVPRGASAAADIELINRGTVDGAWPDVRILGAVAADLIGGYAPDADGRWIAPPRRLAAGDHQVVGWVTGPHATLEGADDARTR